MTASSSSSSSRSIEEVKLSIAEAVSAIRNGQIVHIHAYENEQGEVANVWVAFNVNYERSKARFIKRLDAFRNLILKGKVTSLPLPTYWNWVSKTGERSSKKGPKADGPWELKDFPGDTANADDMKVAILAIYESLVAPKEVKVDFEKIANSVYSKADEETGVERLYLRNVIVVNKVVMVKGEYLTKAGNPHASDRKTVIKDMLMKHLHINQYRTYILEPGKFQHLTLAGEEIVSESFSSEESGD